MRIIAESTKTTPFACICLSPVLSVEARARLYEVYREQGMRADDLAAFHDGLRQPDLMTFWDMVDRHRTARTIPWWAA